MFKRLVISAFFSIAVAAVASRGACAGGFDDEVLRQSVTSLTKYWGNLFSHEQLEELRLAVRTATEPHLEGMLAHKVQIEVSINPESRVTAHRTTVPLSESRCNVYAEWLIRIDNAGYVTAPLVIDVVDAPGSHAMTVKLTRRKLTGAKVEFRVMQVLVEEPMDATLRFTAGPDSADLGRRAEVPVLVTCSQDPGNSATRASGTP